MKRSIRLTALALLASVGVSVAAIEPAQAGSKGRRNTAIGLGAVAVYGVVKKKPLVAGLAGGGAIYSYVSSRKAARRERARRHARARYRRVTYYRNGRRYSRYVRR
jgi:hypothetical protein